MSGSAEKPAPAYVRLVAPRGAKTPPRAPFGARWTTGVGAGAGAGAGGDVGRASTSTDDAGGATSAAGAVAAEPVAIAVLVDVDPDGRAAPGVADVAAQIPDADTLPPGTLVAVLPAAGAPRGVFARLLGGRARADVPRAVRGAALLARGYVEITAAEDDAAGDLVWGRAPAPPRAT